MRRYLALTISALATYASAEGTLVYDQQSSTNESVPAGIVIGNFQAGQPLGQSFVPSLSSIGFIRLYFDDVRSGEGGATVFVNLWSGSISNGTLLATTDPLFIPDRFFNYTNLFFPAAPSLTPGATYYFQPYVQSGNPLGTAMVTGFHYTNGVEILRGSEWTGLDLWFREGIVVVPEPTTMALPVTGIAGLSFYHRKRNPAPL